MTFQPLKFESSGSWDEPEESSRGPSGGQRKPAGFPRVGRVLRVVLTHVWDLSSASSRRSASCLQPHSWSLWRNGMFSDTQTLAWASGTPSDGNPRGPRRRSFNHERVIRLVGSVRFMFIHLRFSLSEVWNHPDVPQKCEAGKTLWVCRLGSSVRKRRSDPDVFHIPGFSRLQSSWENRPEEQEGPSLLLQIQLNWGHLWGIRISSPQEFLNVSTEPSGNVAPLQEGEGPVWREMYEGVSANHSRGKTTTCQNEVIQLWERSPNFTKINS